jgi:hypothetical protein
MITSRRSFLTGLASVIAAPAIVRMSSLMPVKAMPSAEDLNALLHARLDECYQIVRKNMQQSIFYSTPYAPVEFTGFEIYTGLVQPATDFPFKEWVVPVTLDSPPK